MADRKVVMELRDLKISSDFVSELAAAAELAIREND